ncbi:MAG TPA: hypothetical protein VLG67_01355 [Candidatus Saccharimonadales bacterium]|nr:hypothetical protein [Candidatus Saccharimonadales bacterium]
MNKFNKFWIIALAVLALAATACNGRNQESKTAVSNTTVPANTAPSTGSGSTAGSTGSGGTTSNTCPSGYTCTPAGGSGTTGSGSTTGSGGTTSNTPYGLDPQPQIHHPSLYVETGVPCSGTPTAPGLTCSDTDDHQRVWTFQLQPGSAAVIGGFKVDGVSEGVYKTVESGQVNTTVKDGFLSIIEKQWLCGEFQFRVTQAVTHLPEPWAHQHITPPSGCTVAGSTAQPAASASGSASAAPVATCDTSVLGGTWTHGAGNAYTLNSAAKITNKSGWIIHTDSFPHDPGLPVGQSEDVKGATAFCPV